MSLLNIHDRLAVSAVLFAGVCAVWGFINYLRGQDMTSGYWGALVICEILMIAQGILGIVLALEGNAPPRAVVHYLYGISAVISLPAVYVFTGGRDTRRESLLYAVVSLWLFGLAIRGITTGSEQPATTLWLQSLVALL
ncbi:MAG: hypothetical protein R2844_11290 [Caldilineales bacterium]